MTRAVGLVLFGTILITAVDIANAEEISFRAVITTGKIAEIFDHTSFVGNFLTFLKQFYPSYIVAGAAVLLAFEKYFRFSLLVCIFAGVVTTAIHYFFLSGSLSSYSLADSIMVIATLGSLLTFIFGPISGFMFWLLFVFKNARIIENIRE